MGTLAVVEHQLQSGLPKDKIVHTFAFADSGMAQGSKAAMYNQRLAELYTLADTTLGETLGSHLGVGLSRAANASSIKLYNLAGHLDGSPHGSPYSVANFTLPASLGTTPMPEEVALCVTYEATDRAGQLVEVPDGTDPNAAPDRPRQRYTGRTYFGPWNTADAFNDASKLARPATALPGLLRRVVVRMADAIDTDSADLAALAVWSRADNRLRGVEYVRTDDAWDTQRRRGVSPTAVTRLRVADAVPEIELGA